MSAEQPPHHSDARPGGRGRPRPHAGVALAAALTIVSTTLPVAATVASVTPPPMSTATTHHRAAATLVRATVPHRATTVIDGNRVRLLVARPTVLQQRTPAGWSASARRTAGRTSGTVAYAVAPAATTTYRVVAPKQRVRLTGKQQGRRIVKQVTLPPWTGPVRTVAVTSPPSQPPARQPDQQPTQQPTQQPADPQPPRELVSLLTPRGTAGNPSIADLSMDATGRYVAFSSSAPDLVPGDDNGTFDVFLADTREHTVELVSRAPDGSVGNQSSWDTDVSADGRFVAFASHATNLVDTPNHASMQVYVLDRTEGTIELVSAAAGEAGDGYSRSPSISGDGRFVAFETIAADLAPTAPEFGQISHIVRHDRVTGSNYVASWPRTSPFVGASSFPHLSGDGRRVAFNSSVDNLTVEDGNGRSDVFLFDFDTSTRQRISRSSDGGSLREHAYAQEISGDGNTVIWYTAGSGVVPGDDNDSTDAFAYDVSERVNVLLSRDEKGRTLRGFSSPLAVSHDGRTVVLGSTWGSQGDGTVYYRVDRATGRLMPLWVSGAGRSARARFDEAAVADDGSAIAFVADDALTEDDTAAGPDLYVWRTSAE